MTAPLSFHQIDKRFGSVHALDQVDLELNPGEVHALLGQNGAGKTTLVEIATGMQTPDAGELRQDGARIHVPHPGAARDFGVGMVHQHFALVGAMTVAENLALFDGRRPPARKRLEAWAAERMGQFGFDVDPGRRIEDLSVGERQRVEIARALEHARRVLILDEPTAVLAPREVEDLLDRLDRLRQRGLALVLITHKLPEVERIADRVTVLRAGRVVFQSARGEFDPGELATWLAGDQPDSIQEPDRRATSTATPLRLRVDQLAGDGFGPVSLELRAGEVVGIAGVDGNGQREFAETLAGLRRHRRGQLDWATQRTAFISGDRRHTGLATNLPIAENSILHRFHLRQRILRKSDVTAQAERILQRIDVRMQHVWQAASELSGGNQQKVVVARELATDPEAILAENPTRGLDLGATRFVRDALRDATAGSSPAGVLLFSTDLDEIFDLADRDLVAYRGRLTPCPMERDAVGRAVAGL